MTPRAGLAVVVLAGLACTPKPSGDALSRGVAFLHEHQGADGSWRSDRYPAFRDGASLTPLVALALLEHGESPAVQRASSFLAGFAKDGSIDAGKQGLSYPVYSAALATSLLSRFPEHRGARDAWLTLLREHQLSESLGWSREDKEYGGWGFASRVPHKPKPGELAPGLIESNLSATVFALEALRAAGVPDTDPAWSRAAFFVARCQNFGSGELDDGGFFFIYEDPVRNKAGETVPGRFASYGSATADGIRALRALGAAAQPARLEAATAWLQKNFDAQHHPGVYAELRRPNRDAVYYYYVSSVTAAMRGLSQAAVWRAALTTALFKRERPQGGWANELVDVREDDPVLATALAVGALARARP